VLSGRGLCDGLITRPERSPTDCGASLCVIKKPRKTRRLKSATGLWKIQPKWVVTERKQTTNKQTNINILIKKQREYLTYKSNNLFNWANPSGRALEVCVHGRLLAGIAGLNLVVGSLPISLFGLIHNEWTLASLQAVISQSNWIFCIVYFENVLLRRMCGHNIELPEVGVWVKQHVGVT
jgi:hypothetical protein